MTFPFRYSVAILLALILTLNASNVMAQVEIDDRSRPLLGRDGVDSPLLPWGDGRTTRRVAIEMLTTEGFDYIDHFACRGNDCNSGGSFRSFDATNRNQKTVLTLIGFHPEIGAASLVVLDAPCDRSLTRPQSVRATNASNTVCFAGKIILSRVLLDNFYSATSDGWTFSASQRHQSPARPVERVAGEGRWIDTGTLTALNTGEGWLEFSDGAWTTQALILTDPEGMELSRAEVTTFIIPSTGTPDDPTGADPVPGRTTQGQARTIAGNSETRQACADQARERTALLDVAATAVEEVMSLAQDIGMAGLDGFTIGTGGLPGGNANFSAPELPASFGKVMDKVLEASEIIATNDCMEANKVPPTLPEQPIIPSMLLFKNGTAEIITVTEFLGLIGSTCKSSIVETEIPIGDKFCVKTVETECDADCNCTRTEWVACTD